MSVEGGGLQVKTEIKLIRQIKTRKNLLKITRKATLTLWRVVLVPHSPRQ